MDAVITTHTHSYTSFTRLRRLLAFNFIKAPVYAFYTFVNIDELLQRAKKRNFEVLKKIIPFYEIRFHWEIFLGFLENLTTERSGHKFIVTLKKRDLYTLLEKEDSTNFPCLMKEIKKTFHITNEISFETERKQLVEEINGIFFHSDQKDFFFNGMNLYIGSKDEIIDAVTSILKKHV